MRPVAIVVTEPRSQGAGAAPGARIDGAVRPFAQERLNESLGFAIRLGPIGTRSNLPDAQPGAEVAKAMRVVRGAVIGHRAFDPNAAATKPPMGPAQKPRGRAAMLIREHFGIRHPTEIVDAYMN